MEDRTKNFSNLPLISWKIVDKERATQENLELIDLGNGRTLLSIKLSNLPKGMSVVDYIEFIQRTGIVMQR